MNKLVTLAGPLRRDQLGNEQKLSKRHPTER